MNVLVGQLGSRGRIKRLNFIVCGYGEEPLSIHGPGNGSQRNDGMYGILDGNELVIIVSVMNESLEAVAILPIPFWEN